MILEVWSVAYSEIGEGIITYRKSCREHSVENIQLLVFMETFFEIYISVTKLRSFNLFPALFGISERCSELKPELSINSTLCFKKDEHCIFGVDEDLNGVSKSVVALGLKPVISLFALPLLLLITTQKKQVRSQKYTILRIYQ